MVMAALARGPRQFEFDSKKPRRRCGFASEPKAAVASVGLCLSRQPVTWRPTSGPVLLLVGRGSRRLEAFSAIAESFQPHETRSSEAAAVADRGSKP